MTPPTQNRGPLMDITRANNNSTPRKSVGSKRTAPSPFANPRIFPSLTAQNVRRCTNPVPPAFGPASVASVLSKEPSNDNTGKLSWEFSSRENLTGPEPLTLLESETARIKILANIWDSALNLPLENELQACQIQELQKAVDLANLERRYHAIYH